MYLFQEYWEILAGNLAWLRSVQVRGAHDYEAQDSQAMKRQQLTPRE